MKETNFSLALKACHNILENSGLILYPTDTFWAIGCDATNDLAVKKIQDLKQESLNETTICLVANDAMLERYVANVPDLAYDIMDLATKATTIVYDTPKGFAKNVLGTDGSVAVHVANDKFCNYLIGRFKKPIVAAAANIMGTPVPKSFEEIDAAILAGVDYVVNLYQDKEIANPSSIIKLGNDGTVKIIRH
jgi:L-threonylcarbamoyladenylate synthase